MSRPDQRLLVPPEVLEAGAAQRAQQSARTFMTWCSGFFWLLSAVAASLWFYALAHAAYLVPATLFIRWKTRIASLMLIIVGVVTLPFGIVALLAGVGIRRIMGQAASASEAVS